MCGQITHVATDLIDPSLGLSPATRRSWREARYCSNSGQLFPKKQSTAEQSAIFGICCRPAELPRNKLFFERSQASEEPAIDLSGILREVAGSGPAWLKARFRNDG